MNDKRPAETHKIIIDTDIGSDIDDAFAIALALSSPEVEILGFTTASGDTTARAKILDRMLAESGHADLPVAVGRRTTSPSKSFPSTLVGLQRRYGENAPSARTPYPGAVDFIIDQVRLFPGQITLVTIGPLSNVGDLIDRDLSTFRKLKRVVTMGGWLAPVNDGTGELIGPGQEYNILIDVGAAQKLLRSGVPLYLLPLDSTNNLAMDEVKRKAVFSRGADLTNSLALLYFLWDRTTPVLVDAMAVAFVVAPRLCPVARIHINLDDEGMTRSTAEPPNVHVCLRSDSSDFFDFYMGRVAPPPQRHGSVQ